MVQKRPFADEETYEVSSKRQLERSNELFPSLELVFAKDVSHLRPTLGEAGFRHSNTGSDEKLSSDIIAEHRGSAEDIESSAPGCISISSWPTSSTTEEYSQPVSPVHHSEGSQPVTPVHRSEGSQPMTPVHCPVCSELATPAHRSEGSQPLTPVHRSEGSQPVTPVHRSEGSQPVTPVHRSEGSQPVTPVHCPVYSEYYYPEPEPEHEHLTRTVVHCGDVYSLLFNHPPRKPVPIGINHQADIAAWGSQCAKETSNHNGSEDHAGYEDENVLMGACVIPMPDLGSSAFTDGKVGNGISDCVCQDRGSIRCVRQHIMEARKDLSEYLGQEKFVELGFLNMGEVVADKWSDGEEQLFHKIVYSNPASFGRNFWGILSVVFPSRTKREIVSYYFNVFILRRRAKQNRCCPMNIDSDNDEWQGSEDSGDNETGMSEEDEDSVVESPAYNDDFDYDPRCEGDLRIHKDTVDETCYKEDAYFVCGRGIKNISEAYTGRLRSSCSSNLSSQLQDNIPGNEKGDREVQDDSCTSSDAGAASQGMQLKADNGFHWPGSFNELRNGGVHDYVLEPCESKVWDAGYTSCHQNKVDFLPTCSMIEEVFGDGGHGITR